MSFLGIVFKLYDELGLPLFTVHFLTPQLLHMQISSYRRSKRLIGHLRAFLVVQAL